MKKIRDNSKLEPLKYFRIYHLPEGFEVWVGKDSISNDLLTIRYAGQNDLWFHVSGFSGSHTILKIPEGTESIPKEIIKIAAKIAAYYSKARNSKHINISYTRVKYVQKFKGAKSGSVLIKNERTVKVEPGLPLAD